jgi:hypothetical protein
MGKALEKDLQIQVEKISPQPGDVLVFRIVGETLSNKKELRPLALQAMAKIQEKLDEAGVEPIFYLLASADFVLERLSPGVMKQAGWIRVEDIPSVEPGEEPGEGGAG